MIKSEKEKIILEGNKTEILTELSLIIENLIKDIEEEKIIFAVKLGLAGDNIHKKIELAKSEMDKMMEKIENEKNTKENNL